MDLEINMKLIIQRVLSGCVRVGDKDISRIKKGLVVFVGLGINDTPKQLQLAAQKLLRMRLWPSLSGKLEEGKEEKRWDTNVMENDFELILVSQFTLYCEMKGHKPDFHQAKENKEANVMFQEFVDLVKKGYREDRVHTGAFGEYMIVEVVNDGPVTIPLEY